MAKTVNDGFRDFHSRLTPSTGETAAAKSHRASIEACLKRNFDMLRFFRSGSFGSGTSIRGYSDVDYCASIPTSRLKQNSAYTLSEVREVLVARFPNTGVHVDSPAVVVPFGSDASETTEVIPADFIFKNDEGHHIYDIANGSGGWMRTSPEAHNSYVNSVDSQRSGKVKPLIRFIKAWKYYRNVPISSFYLEMRVAKYALGETTILYDWDVHRILNLLWDTRLAPIQDPIGVSGYIYPCTSDAKKSDSLSKLSTALNRAANARKEAQNNNILMAFVWWDLLYDGNFPAYG